MFSKKRNHDSIFAQSTHPYKMVSFVCEACQETLKKPKLDQHKSRCRNAMYTCLDCNTTFEGISYRQHTQCISEAEKYEKSLFKKRKQNNQQNEQKNKQAKVQDPEPVVEKVEPVVETPKKEAAASVDKKKKKTIEKLKSVMSKDQMSLADVKTLLESDEKYMKRLESMLVFEKKDGQLVVSLNL